MKKNIKEGFQRLKEKDVYSILLFILFRLGVIPKYKSLRDMLFMFDRKTLLKLCEFYGGQTVTFPTVENLKDALQLLKMYEEIHINKKDRNTILNQNIDYEKEFIELEDSITNYRV